MLTQNSLSAQATKSQQAQQDFFTDQTQRRYDLGVQTSRQYETFSLTAQRTSLFTSRERIQNQMNSEKDCGCCACFWGTASLGLGIGCALAKSGSLVQVLLGVGTGITGTFFLLTGCITLNNYCLRQTLQKRVTLLPS